MIGLLFRLIVLAFALVLLNGCHVTRPADPTRRANATIPGADAWPSRDLDAVRGFHERTPEVVRRWELNRLTDHGLLRVWSYPDDGTKDEDRFSVNWMFGGGFLENATFLTSRDASGYRLERAMEDVPKPLGTPRRKRNFHLPGLQRTYSKESVMLGRGLDLRIPTELRGHGVLIVLGGLFSTTWQESSSARFEKAGWDVFQINPTSWTRRPNDDEFERAEDLRRKRAYELFQKRSGMKNEDGSDVPMDEWANRVDQDKTGFDDYAKASDDVRGEIPLPPTGFELAPESDPDEVGRTIARSIDDSIAENAYAAQAGLEYLIERHGLESLGAIAVIGYSAGSFAAPAVAARLESNSVDIEALILIGSGADIFTISQNSTITDGGIDLTGDGQYTPTPQHINEARDAYLRHTRLDPYALGPALADIPTLLMIASNDKPVPNGDLLDERLGFPHRIRYFGGHGGLFYFLPQQTPRMIRWLDGVTQNETAPSAAQN